MIHVCLERCPEGAERVLEELSKLQRDVPVAGSYEEKVKAAIAAWEKHRQKRVMKTVCAMLEAMCSGGNRCMFCEDSAASQIDHFRPKTHYPELVFSWTNFLYACSRCNLVKGERFAIRCDDGRILQLPKRTREPPPDGQPLLIDPRCENPLDLLRLELVTGRFQGLQPQGSLGFARAEHTIKLLQLNAPALVGMRMTFREAYRDRLALFVRQKRAAAAREVLENISATLLRYPHRTVWEEMKRQGHMHPELRTLFKKAPEALAW